MREKKLTGLAAVLRLPDEALPILREALTHRTYAVEHGLAYDNQRLEFLGDAVLEIIHTDYLYHRYPALPEGDLTKIRSALSCEAMLAKLARSMDLGTYLLIGKGEKENGGFDRDSTLADLFEAVLGAIYLGCGFEAAKKFTVEIFEKHCPDPQKQLTSLNPKGRLQEFSQSRWKSTPVYRLLRCSGPQHMPCYEVEVSVNSFVTIGSGSNRKQAEISAARSLCDFFSRKYGADI